LPQPIQGVGLVIVDLAGQRLLVVHERQAKPESQREDGQISPPLETAKRGPFGLGQERISHTTRGAFAEVVTDDSLPDLSDSLYQINLPKSLKVSLGPSVRASVMLFVYTGDIHSSPFEATSSFETDRPQWIDIEAFLTRPNARPWGREIVTAMRNRGYLEPDFLVESRKKPFFKKRDSIEDFYVRRERRRDVNL
jgi:hypothetical protein